MGANRKSWIALVVLVAALFLAGFPDVSDGASNGADAAPLDRRVALVIAMAAGGAAALIAGVPGRGGRAS